MKTLIGGMLTALVLLLSATVPAHADVVPTSSSPSHYWDTWHHTHTLTSAQKNLINRGGNTLAAQRATHRTVLDYRIAKAKFGTHITWRRMYAAGWMVYHSVAHISAAERAKVVAIARANHTARFTRSPAALFEPQPLNGCSGRSGTVDHMLSGHRYGYQTWTYLNSCQTNAWVRGTAVQFGVQVGTTAVVIASIPVIGPPLAGVFGVACTIAGYLSTERVLAAQDYSGVHAIVIKTRGWRWGWWYKVAPQ